MSKLLYLIKYLKYLFVSKTKHGVHSPFVFELVTKVIDVKTDLHEYLLNEQLKLKGKKNKKYLKLLVRLCQYFQPKNILEISSHTLEKSNLLAKINPQSKLFYVQNNNIKQDHKLKVIDLVLIRSNINSINTIRDIELGLKYIHNDSFLIIENIHKTKKMESVWSKIITHNKVSVSIDLFQIGIILFRKEQVKEKFIIRF